MNDIEKQWCKAKLEVRGDRFKELYCPDGYGCLLIEQKEGFSSIIPSVNTVPLLATVNRPIRNGFERGIVMPRAIDGRSYDTILPLGMDFNFIDGIDGGLVRVNASVDGQKKWGLLALLQKEECYEFHGVIIESDGRISFTENLDNPKEFLVYDNMWNFYKKNRNHIPAEIDDLIKDISLYEIRKKMRDENVKSVSISSSHIGKQTEIESQKSDEIVSYLEEVTVQNFKRFAECTTLDLSSDITFIVGKNNAGKSTLLKAVNFCCFNLQRLNFAPINNDQTNANLHFAFQIQDILRGTHSVTLEEYNYEELLNNSLNSKDMLLSITSGGWIFEFKLSESSVVQELTITNKLSYDKLVFKPKEINIFLGGMSEGCIHFDCSKNPWIIDGWDLVDPYDVHNDISSLSGIDVLLRPLRFLYDQLPQSDETIRMHKIFTSIENALDPCQGTIMMPVFASIVSDRVDAESEDFVSSAISEYEQIDMKYHGFVCKWLKRMEMGEDFDVKKNTNGYYSVTITQQNRTCCNLRDMGTGTIHFVALCFKILSFIHNYRKNRYVPTLLIMEPEQNLHPMLQSHMVNFLMDISDLYSDSFGLDSTERRHLKIVVETHSEYMIRRSQVIAKRFADRGKEIPFRTYYFPSDRKPYDMVYRKDGRFENPFGPGFTDESTMLSYQLI